MPAQPGHQQDELGQLREADQVHVGEHGHTAQAPVRFELPRLPDQQGALVSSSF